MTAFSPRATPGKSTSIFNKCDNNCCIHSRCTNKTCLELTTFDGRLQSNGGQHCWTMRLPCACGPSRRCNSAACHPAVHSSGSTVVSDCWRAFKTISLLVYRHPTVNHSLDFMDPVTGACTNNIECHWKHAGEEQFGMLNGQDLAAFVLDQVCGETVFGTTHSTFVESLWEVPHELGCPTCFLFLRWWTL